MYCLVQLYIAVAAELAPHKPLLKLFSIKAVGRYLSVLRLMITLTDYPSISYLLASNFLIFA
jgi:hypothetical protein